MKALLVLACFALCALFDAGVAHARRSGLAAAGCEGCHTGGKLPKVTITTEPAVFGPGDTVTASVTIQAVNGGPGGLYFAADIGRFTGIAGEGTTLVSDTELTHDAPRAAQGGNVVFQVRWTAPAQANAVYFEAWALSSNGNGSASGDGAGQALSTVLFGCAGSPYYLDLDGDGFGDPAGAMLIKCAATPGFSSRAGDCNDSNREIYPGAAELCNAKDDNCDGRVDEQARPRCGKGWCERLSTSCDPAACVPGQPAAEVCNGADDDCNGYVDDAPGSCGTGLECRLGICTSASDVATGGASIGGQQAGGASGEAGRPAGAVAQGGTASGASSAAPSGGQGLIAGEEGPRSAGCAFRPVASFGDGAVRLALATGLSSWLFRRRRAAASKR